MELSSLKFSVDTTELEKASGALSKLTKGVSDLNRAAKEQAQTEAALSRAAKDQARANLDNAKAQDVRLKSTIAADKADQAREASTRKATEATERASRAAKENVTILQRQSDILEFQTQGWSKGQSSILATAKAAKITTEEMKELQKVLETQRKLMGTDPFDKSLSGIKSLQNQYGELRESIRQYNAQSDLSSKQTRELARDKERLIVAMKAEGSSFSDIRRAVREHNTEYVKLANQYNTLIAKEEQVVKQRKEIVAATNYVTQADQKMAAALNISNAALDKAGTDSLVRYEAALRKSGVAQDVVTQKLATYKAQLAQVQSAEEKRKAANLSRALSPQITDIAVSLYSGQAPLTVLLQQGGQILDLFKLSGIEAQNFGKSMREAFTTMIPAMAVVIKGMGSFAAGLFIDAAKGVNNFIAEVTGLNKVLDILHAKMTADGPSQFTGMLRTLGTVATTVTTVGILAVIAVIAALAIEYKNIIQTEAALSKALATSGGALGFSKDQAVAYAESLKDIGVGTLTAEKAITAFANAGKVGREELDAAIKSAVELQKTAGVAIEDTAKEFAKLQDSPTKTLAEIAEKTGLVEKSTLDVVSALEQQGDKGEAARIATLALASANIQAALEIKANLSPIEQLWNDIRGAIGRVKQEIHELATSNAVINGLKTVWETVSVVISEVWFTIKGVGKEIGGIAAQIGAVLRGDFAGAAAIGDQMKADAAAARAEQDKFVAAILNRSSEEKKSFNERKQENSQYAAWMNENAKALEKQYTKDERFAHKKAQLQKDLNSNLIDEVKYNEALAGWKRIIYGDKKEKVDKQPIKDMETQVDLWNKSIGLSATYNNEYQAIVRQLQRGKITQEEFNILFEALLAKQPVMIAYQKDIAASHELSNKLLGKSDQLGKDYYKTLEKIAEYSKKGMPGYNAEEAEKLRQAAFNQTELVKNQNKYLQESAKEYNKIALEAQKAKDQTALANEENKLHLAILGKSTDEAKLLNIQGDASLAILKERLKLSREQQEIDNKVSLGKIDPFTGEQAKLLLAQTTQDKILEIQKASIDQLFIYYSEKTKEYSEQAAGTLSDLFKSSGQLSFGNAVSSLNSMVKSFEILIDQQKSFNVLRDAANGDSERLARINEISAKAQLKSYGDLTRSFRGFFKEGTTGYKALTAAEKVFRTVELALALKNAAVKIAQEGSVLAARLFGDKAAEASAVSSSATIVAAKQAEAASNAAVAVTNQGAGDPYTAFARIAAMAALMAALGFAVGGSGGGGSQAQSSNKGTGTVFGDKDAKSESVAKSLKILEDVNTLTMHYSYQMLRSLRSIETALTGVTNVILRSGGMQSSAAGTIEGVVTSGLGNTINSFLDILGLDKFLGGIVGKLFGTKTTITGQGVYVNDASYQQILASDIEAGYYTDINKKKKTFGITTSNRNSTNYTPNEEISQQFAKILNGFVDTIKMAAPILGISLEQIDTNLRDFVLKIGKIDLKDLKGDEIKERLLAVFGAAGDDIARAAIGGFERFQQVGEGYLETIIRLATTVETVRGAFDTLNQSVNLSIDDVMSLVDEFGDLEKFNQSIAEYNNSYYTEAERNQNLLRQLTAEFGRQNLALPKTKEEYRKLVEQQDLTTEEGRKMYAILLQMAPAFAVVADAAEELRKELESTSFDLTQKLLEAEADAYDSQGNSALALQRRREALELRRKQEYDSLLKIDPALAKLVLHIYELEDASEAATAAGRKHMEYVEKQRELEQRLLTLQGKTRDALDKKRLVEWSAVRDLNPELAKMLVHIYELEDAVEWTNKAYSALEKAVNAEKSIISKRIETSTSVISALTEIFDILKSSVDTLYGEVSATAKLAYLQSRGIVNAAVATALSGGQITPSDQLTEAIQNSVSGLKENDFATKTDYDRQRLLLAGQLSILKSSTSASLTNEQKMLASLQDQEKALDATLEYWKMQIEIANGTYEATLSVTQAVNNLISVMQYRDQVEGKSSTTPTGNTGGGSGVSTDTGAVFGGTTAGMPSGPAAVLPRDDYGRVIYPDGSKGPPVDSWFEGTTLKWAKMSPYNPANAGKNLPALPPSLPGFAKGGYYSGGLALVGEEGPELINFRNPGQVYTNSQTMKIASNAGSSMDTERLEKLLVQVVENTKKTSDTLRNVSPDGDSFQINTDSLLEL